MALKQSGGRKKAEFEDFDAMCKFLRQTEKSKLV